MKKTLLITLAFLVSGFLQAQDKFETGITAGGGYFATITGKNEFSITNSFSANVGFYLLQPVFDKQFIESGLIYNFRKTAIDESFLQVDMDINSLEIPLLYGYKFDNNLILKAGVSGRWLVEKNVEREKIEIDGQLGLGYDLNRIKIFLNYQHGLNKSDFMYKYDNRGLFIDYGRT